MTDKDRKRRGIEEYCRNVSEIHQGRSCGIEPHGTVDQSQQSLKLQIRTLT
jgi:hypothetical protein